MRTSAAARLISWAVPRRFVVRETLLYIGVAVVATLATIFALRLWHMTPSIPLLYRADAVFNAGNIDAVLKTGWYEVQPALAAPFGQVLHDFPIADNLHLALIGALGIVGPSFGVAINAYYLLGFPLAALAAAWFFRSVGLARAYSLALAVLFAIAPYHFSRGENHLWLASYWSIPLFGVLLVRVMLGRGLWNRRSRTPKVLGLLTWQNAGTLVILAVLGSATQYYAVFDLILLAIAGLLAFLRDRRIRALAGTVVGWLILAGVLLANMLPDFVYAWSNGPNYATAYRPAVHTEWFALRLVQLLLPSSDHRFAPFRELARSYESQFPIYTYPSLGIVAGAGLIVLLATLTFAAIMSFRRMESRVRVVYGRVQKGLLAFFSAMTMWILLIALTGGLSVFVALLVTTKIRGWDRLAIYIALFGLMAVGIAIQLIVRRYLRSRRIPSTERGLLARLVIPLTASLLLLVGVWDQTNNGIVPQYDAVKADFLEDKDYVSRLEEAVPASAMIYQLPYQEFPEGPYLVNRMIDYDHLRLSLHSDSLRWSYGGPKGRPATDWPSLLVGMPTKEWLDRVAAVGFAGVSINRLGYADSGAALEADLRATLGVDPIVSSRGTYSYWDLTSYARELRRLEGPEQVEELGYETVHPVIAYGVWPGLTDLPRNTVNDGKSWQATQEDTSLMISTNSSAVTRVSISFFVGSASGIESLTLLLPDGAERVISIDPAGTPVRLDFSVSPGDNYLQFDAELADGAAYYSIQNLQLFVR